MSYTCPHCGRTSHNPNDELNRYCGACHHFCDVVDRLAILEDSNAIDFSRLFGFIEPLAEGVYGYTNEPEDGSLWIPLIQAAQAGSGDVGRYLDSLPRDRKVVVPTVLSSRLAGMLERRGFEPRMEVLDGEMAEAYVRDQA